jgi:AraC family transcriptional regulator, regulatory protein of adaptative response / DNA-3-methyladenine glycosylase II
VFRASPTDLRNRRHRADRLAADGGLTLRLPVVPGYDWDAMRAFLAARLVPGVEAVDGDTYRRTITMAGAPGLLEVSPGGEDCLLLRVHLPYWEGLIHVADRVGLLLGVERDHCAGVAVLRGDPVLGPLVAKHPGLAVPGAWNLFEAGVSAILSGQPDRDRLLGAFVARLGTPVPGLPEGLTHTFPDPATVTAASLAPIGLGPAEASAIAVLAAGREIPEVSDDIAFRLGQRDAFPSGDPSLQAALAHLGLRAPAANWRPWLALAAAHLMAHGDTLIQDPVLV